MSTNAPKRAPRTVRPRRTIPGFEQNVLINELEVAELIGVPRGTLSRWRCAGVGPTFVKLEGSVRYYLSDVHSYVAERRRLSVRASLENRHVAQEAR